MGYLATLIYTKLHPDLSLFRVRRGPEDLRGGSIGGLVRRTHDP